MNSPQQPRQRFGLQRPPADSLLGKVARFLSHDIWREDLERLPWPRRKLFALLRILHLAVRGFYQNRATFTASALTLISVLSLVPSLAFAFALLKGVGTYERLRADVIQPALDSNFGAEADLAPSALALRDAIEKVLDLVSQTDVSQLGFAGLFIIVLAIIRMLDNVELAFNTIWGVARARSLVRKIADYMTIAVVTPVLVVLAVTLTSGTQNSAVIGWLRHQPVLGSAVDSFFGLTPWIAAWLGFSLLYITLPNIQPKLISAVLGGIIGGTLFQLFQIAHIQFQVGVANYNAIYSSFAAFPIFLVWIYMSWVTVMIGAEFAHAHEATGQHREMVLGEHAADPREDVIALQIVLRVARAFRKGGDAWSRSALSLDLNVPSMQLDAILGALCTTGILASAERPDGGIHYLPARELSAIRVGDVVAAMRAHGVTADPDSAREEGEDQRMVQALEEFYAAAQRGESNRSLEELIETD